MKLDHRDYEEEEEEEEEEEDEEFAGGESLKPSFEN
jgi:hypothetical protein